MSKRRGKVLVLGDDTRAPLAVIRSLGRYGLDVHLAWCQAGSPMLRSRYVGRHHDIHTFESNRVAWRAEFIQLCEAEEFDLVVPCTDDAIIPLQQLDPRDVGGRVYLLSPKAFHGTFDKSRTLEIAAELGIRHSSWTLVDTILGLRKAAANFGFPLVVKFRSSFDFDRQVQRRGVRVLFSERDLDLFVEKWEGHEAVIAQKFFAGTGVGVGVLARNGEVLVAVQYERLHEEPLGSGSSYRRTVALDDKIAGEVAAFVRHVGYTGVLMMEFKRNPETSRSVLIEANGRFWGALPLAIAAGADFPRFLFQMLVEGRTTFPRSYREGVYARNLVLDLMWFRSNWRASRGNPYLITRPLASVFWELRHLLMGRETNDTLQRDDPRPGVAEIGALFRHWGNRLRMKLAGHLIRIWGLRRLTPARFPDRPRSGTSIMFLCKGNTCRSPFAAAYLRQQGIQGLAVDSTGYHPKSGRTSPPQACEAARHFGVDLLGHRSNTASRASLEAANVILIFDVENYLWLRTNARGVIDKVAFLGWARRGAGSTIGDPYGKTVGAYKDCYAAIVQSIDALLGALTEETRDSSANGLSNRVAR